MTHAEIIAKLERIAALIAAGQDTETIGRALDALVVALRSDRGYPTPIAVEPIVLEDGGEE